MQVPRKEHLNGRLSILHETGGVRDPTPERLMGPGHGLIYFTRSHAKFNLQASASINTRAESNRTIILRL